MIQIAIVEDDKKYSEVLAKYIMRYEEESGQKFQVSTFEDGEDIIENYKGNYDIILMDIEMRFMDGMTAAEEIRKSDSEVVIIFITNMPQYAMKGYSVEAFDYVLKPINYFSFSQRIDRAISRMVNRQQKFLNISYKGKIKKIDISSIYYVEVQDHNILYHTKDGEFYQRTTMKEVAKKLEQESFFRCNKCYLINLAHVNGFDGNYVMVDNHKVQVSRGRKKELIDVLNNYMNEVSK